MENLDNPLKRQVVFFIFLFFLGTDCQLIMHAKARVLYVPVIDGGRVRVRLVKDLRADSLSSKVAAGVEDAPPDVFLARRRWSCRRHRCGW